MLYEAVQLLPRTKMSLYLDHHATTPLDPHVFEAMVPFFQEDFGNPASGSHGRGLRAVAELERSRTAIGTAIGADPRGLVFTSGATEANNLAIKGVLAGSGERRHLIVAATEHRSVLDPARRLARSGVEVTILPVNSQGHIDLNQLADAITPRTALVSLMAANNETGLLHPLDEIASICHTKGTLWHCDAAQAIGIISFPVATLGVDLVSFTAHKVYGPVGVGALWVRRDGERIPILPLLDGGGQEQGLRSGTVPLPLVIGVFHGYGEGPDVHRRKQPSLAPNVTNCGRNSNGRSPILCGTETLLTRCRRRSMWASLELTEMLCWCSCNCPNCVSVREQHVPRQIVSRVMC